MFTNQFQYNTTSESLTSPQSHDINNLYTKLKYANTKLKNSNDISYTTRNYDGQNNNYSYLYEELSHQYDHHNKDSRDFNDQFSSQKKQGQISNRSKEDNGELGIRSFTPDIATSQKAHKNSLSNNNSTNKFKSTQSIKQLSNDPKVKEEIKSMANSNKMSENSYKMIIKRLENTLTYLLIEVDPQGTKRITFEQLGRILTVIGVFRIIQYDESNNLVNEEDFLKENSPDKQRRYNEMMLHEQIWCALTKDQDVQSINIELVYSFFRIILDPLRLPLQQIENILRDYIEKYCVDFDDLLINQGSNNDDFKPWDLQELIINFRKMSENRLAYVKTGYLKSDQFQEFKKREKDYTFQPKIDKNSEYLAQQNLSKYIGQIESPQPHHNQQNIFSGDYYQKSKIQNLLLEVQDLQKVLKGQKSYKDINTRINQDEGEEMMSRIIPEDITGEYSSGIDNKKYNQLLHVNILLKKQQEIKEKIQEKFHQKTENELKECTFKPQINKISQQMQSNNSSRQGNIAERLYDQNYIKKKEELKKQADLEKLELQEKECTFQPEIIQEKYHEDISHDSSYQLPRGFEQAVGRLRYANQERQKLKEQLEKIPKGENYYKLKTEKVKPFILSSKEKALKKSPPFLYLDVNIGNGKTGRIGLHEDDQPETLAINFSKAFQLNQDMQQSLEELIRFQINIHREKAGLPLLSNNKSYEQDSLYEEETHENNLLQNEIVFHQSNYKSAKK